jgi:hypothetical protein
MPLDARTPRRATCRCGGAPYHGRAHATLSGGPSVIPPPSCVVPRLGSSPVVTPAGEPPYIRRHCLPAGEHRAGRPPLPPSRQARPSAGTSSRPTTFDPPLGPAEAQVLAHCLGNVATPLDFRPQRPAPPAAIDQARRRHPTPAYGPEES